MFNGKAIVGAVSLVAAATLILSACSSSKNDENVTETPTISTSQSVTGETNSPVESIKPTLVTRIPQTETTETQDEVTETQAPETTDTAEEPTVTVPETTKAPVTTQAPATTKPATPTTAAVKLGAKTTLYATGNANVRSGPSTNDKVVGSVVWGQKLVGQLYGNSGWYQIGSGKFISSSVVSKTKPKAPVTTKPSTPKTTKPSAPATTKSSNPPADNNPPKSNETPDPSGVPTNEGPSDKTDLQRSKEFLAGMKSRGSNPIPGEYGCFKKNTSTLCLPMPSWFVKSVWP